MKPRKRPRTKRPADNQPAAPPQSPQKPEVQLEVGDQDKAHGALDDRGLVCPDCGCRHFYVVETRRTWGHRIRRVRECRHCSRRVDTYERAADSAP